MVLTFEGRKDFATFTFEASFSVDNELVVLFGYSGAGKSLILNMISGFIAPDAGNITLNDLTLLDTSRKISLKPSERAVSMVFQNLALFPHMTVEKNILYGAKRIPSSEREAMLEELLTLLRLDKLRTSFPHQISHGQKQRVAIARSMIGKPQLLLLDEPFSSLDMPTRHYMRECVINIIRKRFNIPTILVTHDLDEAASMSDRIFVMAEGSVLQKGTYKEIISSPQNDTVRKLFLHPFDRFQ